MCSLLLRNREITFFLYFVVFHGLCFLGHLIEMRIIFLFWHFLISFYVFYISYFPSSLSLASSSFGRSFCCLRRLSQFLQNRLESWQRSAEIGQEFPFEVLYFLLRFLIFSYNVFLLFFLFLLLLWLVQISHIYINVCKCVCVYVFHWINV